MEIVFPFPSNSAILLSKLTKPIVDTATNLGAVADRLIEGEGVRDLGFSKLGT